MAGVVCVELGLERFVVEVEAVALGLAVLVRLAVAIDDDDNNDGLGLAEDEDEEAITFDVDNDVVDGPPPADDDDETFAGEVPPPTPCCDCGILLCGFLGEFSADIPDGDEFWLFWAPRLCGEEPELLLEADGVGWLDDNDDELGFAKLEGLVTEGGALEYRVVMLIEGLPTPLTEDIALGPGPVKKNKPEPEPGPRKPYVPEEDDGDG